MPSCELNAGWHLIYMRGGIYLQEKYKLVIAEKPSVAMNLAKALGADTRKDGYLEGAGWLVSWLGWLRRRYIIKTMPNGAGRICPLSPPAGE